MLVVFCTSHAISKERSSLWGADTNGSCLGSSYSGWQELVLMYNTVAIVAA